MFFFSKNDICKTKQCFLQLAFIKHEPGMLLCNIVFMFSLFGLFTSSVFLWSCLFLPVFCDFLSLFLFFVNTCPAPDCLCLCLIGSTPSLCLGLRAFVLSQCQCPTFVFSLYLESTEGYEI